MAKFDRFFNDGSLDPATQFELDAAWNTELSQDPTEFELKCAVALRELEPQLSDIPFWALERND